MAGELSFSSEFHHFAIVIRQAFVWPVGLGGLLRQDEVNYLLLLGFFLGFLLSFFLGGLLLCYFLLRYFPLSFFLSSFLLSFSFCHV